MRNNMKILRLLNYILIRYFFFLFFCAVQVGHSVFFFLHFSTNFLNNKNSLIKKHLTDFFFFSFQYKNFSAFRKKKCKHNKKKKFAEMSSHHLHSILPLQKANDACFGHQREKERVSRYFSVHLQFALFSSFHDTTFSHL